MARTTHGVYTALSDPTRRAILRALRKGSKTAGELAAAFDLTKPTLSHHFRVLQAVGLLRAEKRGTSIVYTLQSNVLEDLATEILEAHGRQQRTKEGNIMNRASRAFDVATLLVLGGTAAITASAYASLPAEVPIHFDSGGNADGWLAREVGAWLLVAIAGASWAVARSAERWAPSAWRDRVARTPLPAAGFLVTALLCGIQVLVLWSASHPGQPIGRPLAFALGGFLLSLSFLLPRVRRNPVLGIRVPWTLASDENWARTHRFASYTCGAAGVMGIVAALEGGAGASQVAVVALILGTLTPAVYSYVLARGRV